MSYLHLCLSTDYKGLWQPVHQYCIDQPPGRLIALSVFFCVVVVLVVVKRNKTGVIKYPFFYTYIPKNIL